MNITFSQFWQIYCVLIRFSRYSCIYSFIYTESFIHSSCVTLYSTAINARIKYHHVCCSLSKYIMFLHQKDSVNCFAYRTCTLDSVLARIGEWKDRTKFVRNFFYLAIQHNNKHTNAKVSRYSDKTSGCWAHLFKMECTNIERIIFIHILCSWF